MRLSSKPSDPGFGRFVALRQLGVLPLLRIFVDGDNLRSALVVTADEEEGFVEVRPVDYKGKMIEQRDGANVLVTRRVEGKVVIKVGQMARTK